MRRLRVLHVGKFYPPHPGGMESHVELLARLTGEEVDVRVLVSNQLPETLHEVRDGIPVTRIGQRLRFASASFGPGMARAIRAADADLVHFHHPNPPAVLSWFAARSPARLLVTYHSDIVRQRVLGTLFSPLLHRFLAGAGAIIASSPAYAATSPVLRRHADRVRVIPFGVDTAGLSHPDPALVARLRERYGPRVVLAAGRLVYYKGFAHLVRAMARVDGHLLIAGDGPLWGELERVAAAAGVTSRVTLLGRVDELAPFYHAARVFALPSVARSEAFGLVQLEAMACGVPVVNTALDSGVPFVSPDRVSGLTVAPGDEAALAAALTRLLDDAELRQRLGRGGRERATGELSPTRMAERTLQLYHELTAQSPLPTP